MFSDSGAFLSTTTFPFSDLLSDLIPEIFQQLFIHVASTAWAVFAPLERMTIFIKPATRSLFMVQDYLAIYLLANVLYRVSQAVRKLS